MKKLIFNEAHTVGLVQIEDEDPYIEHIEIDPTLLKDALKMLDPYKPEGVRIGILKAGEAGVLVLTPVDQEASVAIAGRIQNNDQRHLDDFGKEDQ